MKSVWQHLIWINAKDGSVDSLCLANLKVGQDKRKKTCLQGMNRVFEVIEVVQRSSWTSSNMVLSQRHS